MTERPWLNQGTDLVSSRVYALIFNGLTGALRDFMPLSERERVTSAIYDALADGGVEVRLTSGLDRLRAASADLESEDKP